jgi:hypothetical protein
MDLNSKTLRGRPHWPCATALTLMLAAAFAAPVFADDDERETRTEKEEPTRAPWEPKVENPCWKPPVASQAVEEVSCAGTPGPDGKTCGGTTKTTTRTTQKQSSCEQRTFTQSRGFGTGSQSQVRYKLEEDRLIVTRHKGSSCTSPVLFERQMGNPERRFALLTGVDTGARPFFVTKKSDPVNGTVFEADTKCRDRKGNERRDDQD